MPTVPGSLGLSIELRGVEVEFLGWRVTSANASLSVSSTHF